MSYPAPGQICTAVDESSTPSHPPPQQHVLSQLVVNHHLTAAQAHAAYAVPLPLPGQR